MSENRGAVRISLRNVADTRGATMTRRDDEGVPEGPDSVIRRLRDERPQLDALELDNMKSRVMARARPQRTKGAGLRGRIVVAVLSLSLLGAGAGGVVAASGGSGQGASSAVAQYHKHCRKHHHRHHGKCVKNKHHHRKH
jgi:hypothetical protein